MAVAEGVGVPAAAEVLPHDGRKPPALVKLSYSVGQVVESGYLAMNTFVFFYYTAVLGLSGTLVGTALAISMCLDAVFDPFIGSWSDSVRSRLGRRVPVMLVGAPLTFLTLGMLFAPPSGLTPLLLFFWLTASKMGVRAFASMFNIPYFTLGGEMTDDYVERARIVAWRLMGGILATVAINLIAFTFFFTGEIGLQRKEAYAPFGWLIAAVMLAGALVSCLGVWRYAAALPRPTERPAPMLPRLPGEVREIFRNRSFRILFLSMLMFTSAAGLNAALNNHTFVFVWKLPPGTIQFVAYALLLGITAGIPVTPLLLRRMEKKAAMLWGFALVIVPWMVLPTLRALGILAPTGYEALWWMLSTSLIVGLGSGLIFIALPSMMADAADEHEHVFGTRREGLYFSGLGFAGKAAAGVGTMVGGFALDLMHFPAHAGAQVGAVIPEDVVGKLILAWGFVPAAMSVVGALIFLPYAITRVRHTEISAAIKVKRAADVSAGRSS
ncbi:MAG: MFS transporter [Phenylobacterium sp.]|uniref:MFS transporter n=1 Tax=Phenylobacterium sp. TaxID=1871053 RepID=UPI001A63E615|nr:MFS transporter [Phenylobacterium sp.]MBL8553277.1 MFS transporter [Phenylobacterium sp.]